MHSGHSPNDTTRHRPADRGTSTLAVASIASVSAAVVASACGTGPVATLVVAALAPWITAFITHPGPHRWRRVALVALFAACIRASRAAAARVRSGGRRAARTSDSPRQWAARRADLVRGARRPARLAGATAGAAFAIGALCLTVPELVLGDALLANRRLTLLPVGAAHPPAPPKAGAPTLRVPGAVVTREATDRAGARVTYRVSALDSRRAALTADCTPASGLRFPIGTTRVTCVAVQSDGRSTRKSFLVVVVRKPRPNRPGPSRPGAAPPISPPKDHERDAQPPHLRLPGLIRAQARDRAGARVKFAVRALDAVDGAVPIDCSVPSGAVFVVGRTYVTCTAADRAGNVAHGGFDIVVAPVTIADRTPPRLALPSGIRVVAPAGGRATPVRFRARATDERDGDVPVRCAPASGSRFGVGRTTVRCSATDRAGNTGAGSFVVLVAPPRREPEPAPDEDPRPAEGTGTTPGGDTATTPTTPDPDPDEVGPVFERFPDIQQTGTSSDGAIVNYNPPRAVDDRDGPVDVSCTPPSGSFFAIGSQGVTCTARDRAGNVSTASATVTVDPPPTGE